MAFENIERKKQGLPEKSYSASQEKRAFMEAYNSTISLVRYVSKFAPVFTIFGNVESSNYETTKCSRRIGLHLPYIYNDLNSIKNVRVINNVIARHEGIRIGGLEYFLDTNWVKEFKPNNFEKRIGKAKRQTAKARRVLDYFKSVDILVCHQPPHQYLDKVSAPFAPKNWQGKHAGSKAIIKYIKTYQPKYVFCGHIHEGAGAAVIGKTHVYNLGTGQYKLIEL